VLDGIDLAVAPGTGVAIIGANGAGKTTLLRIAAGLLAPERGSVHLGDLDAQANRTAYQRRVGFLSAASAGLYARLSVRAHLRFWSRLALMGGSEREHACGRVMHALALDELADRRVDRLSMGQRQRVRLAGAFVHDPAIVLLDEPGNSLDEEGLDLLAAEAGRVLERDGAVVWCAPSGDRLPVQVDVQLRLQAGQLVAA